MSLLRYSRAVKSALKNGDPIVALESTILTHGLPPGVNINVARQCEQAIVSNGATPATIFIDNGKIHIGAEEDELEMICSGNRPAKKVSRRDLPGVLASGGLGGTTVSGTSIAANMAGIELFATGGIGGVHRGAERTMDVSADLYELSRTPIFVVCAGVKSILDIGLTLEVLETLGVGVYTIGEDDKFPAFYVRDSGFSSPGGAIDIKRAAEIVSTTANMNLTSGSVFGNPIPTEFEGNGSLYEGMIEQAVKESEEKRISGSQSTPFILSRLAELSKGETVKTNIALVVNNAATAAKIAFERNDTKNIQPRVVNKRENVDEKRLLVVGMTNVDTIWKATNNLIPGGASNIANVSQYYGGVGYNLALSAARNCPERKPVFLTCVGDDSHADNLERNNEIDIELIRVKDATTGQYTCIVNNTGEISLAIQDMKVSSAFQPSKFPEAEFFDDFDSILVDFNLPSDTLNRLFELNPGKRFFIEPTSLFKIFGRHGLIAQAEGCFPNLEELLTIQQCLNNDKEEPDYDMIAAKTKELKNSNNLKNEIFKICKSMDMPNYFIVTVAEKGAFYVTKEDIVHYELHDSVDWNLIPDSNPVHTNGCGDTLAGVFVSSVTTNNMSIDLALKRALTASQISLRSDSNIPDILPKIDSKLSIDK